MLFRIALPIVILLSFALWQGCGQSNFNDSEVNSSVTTADALTNTTLSSSVISELETNLSNTSSSRNSRVSSRSSSKALSNSLNSSQINQIIAAAEKAVSDAGFNKSEDLIQLMPKIIEGTQTKLSSVG